MISALAAIVRKKHHGLEVLDKIERIFVVLSILLYLQAVVPLFIIRGANEGDGVDLESFDYSIQNMLYIANYLVTTSLLLLRWQRVLAYTLNNIGFVVLLGMAPLSLLWSSMPDDTFTASVGIIGTTFFAIYLSSRFTLEEILRLFGWAYVIALCLSLFFIVALPKYGIMSGVHEGAIRGVWTHKNTMGGAMIISNYLFLILAMKSRMKNFYILSCLAVSILLTIGTQSTNSLLNSLLSMLFVIALGHIFKYSLSTITLIAAFLVPAIWGLFVLFSDISAFAFQILGKDPTLTGRTDIWAAVLDKISERPWLGYGLNGFWHGLYGESADVVRALRWDVPNSHNGYLDLVLQIGLVGLAIFTVVYFTAFTKALLLAQDNSGNPEYLFPLTYLFFVLFSNIAEPSMLVQNNISWVLFATMVTTVNFEFNKAYSQMPSQV